ncbi:SDR family oxidoreductase [Mucilaginibacter sp.]|uniref:SDR family oxidoreductase n=1 Tax=Mucilaginibacter sp. TaxID=1882438 RepID=UPI00261CE85B|nr:SDR family oxidoreductase [Mucilaginibacter sp.]MDB4924199.1 family oxidoreductase [Mucilaginibacter sp.]
MEQLTKTNGSLTGKKVVILGGSSGIGLATAKAAAQEGATVVIVSSNQQRIDNALVELPAGNKGFAVDLTDEQQIKDFFIQLGKFDHLVYTAGESLQLVTIADVPVADAQRFFNLRYWGAFMAVKYASPYINTGGSITLTGGIAALRPGSGWSLGASICAAMEGFTRAMAIELAPVRVNLVSPGVVRTNLWSAMSEEERENLYTSAGNNLPVKRIGEAEDIAQTYLYLIGQQYSTGQIVVVDGGSVLV